MINNFCIDENVNKQDNILKKNLNEIFFCAWNWIHHYTYYLPIYFKIIR